MNVYLISTRYKGYDTYDSAVVLAESEEEARNTHPNGRYQWKGGHSGSWSDENAYRGYDDTWAPPEDVRVELIARNVEAEFLESKNNNVVCSSYNAG
jgi:hypothetical protein